MTLGLSTRAKKALAHLRVETPDQLRHHAGQMNAGVELCLISIPRCGWSTVIEIMEWCGEPLSHHAQMVADRVRRDERSASPAAALTEAQGTIARLEAALREAVEMLEDGWGTEQVTKESTEEYFELMPRLKAELSPKTPTKAAPE